MQNFNAVPQAWRPLCDFPSLVQQGLPWGVNAPGGNSVLAAHMWAFQNGMQALWWSRLNQAIIARVYRNIYIRPSMLAMNDFQGMTDFLYALFSDFTVSLNSSPFDPKLVGMYTWVKRDNFGNYATFTGGPIPPNLAAFGNQFQDVIDWLSEENYNQANGPYWITEISIRGLLPPPGIGGAKRPLISTANERTSKKNKYEPRITQKFKSRDYSCLIQALVLLALYSQEPSLGKYLNHKNTGVYGSDRHRLMESLVRKVYASTGLQRDCLCGLSEAKILAAHFSSQLNRMVCIFCFDSSFNFIWRTSEDFDEKTLFFDVLWNQHHFTAVDKIHTRIKRQKNFCRKCCTTFSRAPHRCKQSAQVREQDLSCKICGGEGDHFSDWVKAGRPADHWKTCDLCSRSFPGEKCFETHLSEEYDQKRTMCQAKWKCLECKLTFINPKGNNLTYQKGNRFQTREDHRCNITRCNGCDNMVDKDDHYCSIQPYEIPEGEAPLVYYYDIESRVDPEDPEMNHVPVCLVIMEETAKTVDDSFVFYSMELALEFILDHPGIYIAHNGSNYDIHILLRYLVRYKEQCSYQFVAGAGTCLFETRVQRGGKKMTKKKSIIFKDSLRFVPAALAKFHKMFGIPAMKGHFPFQLLNELGPEYIGPKPPIEQFMLRKLNEAEKDELKDWYSQLDATYDLKKQMTYYCQMDTLTLLQGMNKFRTLFKEYGGIDPLVTSSTIAGSVFRSFTSKFMEPMSIQQLRSPVGAYYRTFLRGGRVEVFKPWGKNVPMQYTDVTSEYPFINFTGLYPKGEMKEHTFGQEGILYEELPDPLKLENLPNNRVSFMVVDVVCPDDLHIPLLHDEDQERLLFSLRKKTKMGYTCMELQKALTLGYKITRVFAVCTWQDSSIGFGGSAKYIATFFKLKLLAAGLPKNNTPEENAAYCAELKALYGFEVKPEQFEANPGLYAVSKLALNSLWGKFSQRDGSSFSNTHILGSNDMDKYERIRTQIKRCIPLPNDQCLVISQPPLEHPESIARNTNPFVGLFTTAQARLHLYKGMEAIGLQRVVYCDTDSLVYVCKPDQKRMPESSELGGWVSELPLNAEIRQWASSGPKAYGALIYERGSQDLHSCILKVKGHSLKAPEAAHMCFTTIEDAVLIGASTEVNYTVIQRPRKGEFFRVHTAPRPKKFGPTAQKRVVLPMKEGDQLMETRPYTDSDVLPFKK